MKKFLISFCLPFLFTACIRQAQSFQVAEITESTIEVDAAADSIQDTAYLAILAPKTAAVNDALSEVIGQCPVAMGPAKGPESPLLNWASDAIFKMAKKYYSGRVDMAVTNKGGLRCEIPQGDVTLRTIFELMPFENKLVILNLKGSSILRLADEFAEQGGQGIAGMTMEIKNGKAQNVKIGKKKVVPNAIYNVATSDYLSNGTDGLVALAEAVDMIDTNVNLRDIYIDYVRSTGTMTAECDGRTKLAK